MKPNLPKRRVKGVLIDCNLSIEAQKMLESLNIRTVKTIPVKSITDSTATHPDMQFSIIGDKTALVCDCVFEYYKDLLPEFNLIPITGICSPYPDDCLINITVINDKCFMTNYQKEKLDYLNCFKVVKVRQGYTKCNICILNESSIITSDKSISASAINSGFNVYFLPDNQIKLVGYDHGFWGGACGLIDKNLMFFTGDITRLDCYGTLIKILKKEKIEPVYPSDISLMDNGSIIPLY